MKCPKLDKAELLDGTDLREVDYLYCTSFAFGRGCPNIEKCWAKVKAHYIWVGDHWE